MSSYKPVIYIFGAIGLLGSVGLAVTAVQGIRAMSSMNSSYSMDDYMDESMMGGSMRMMNPDGSMATSSMLDSDYSNMRMEDSSDDQTMTSPFPTGGNDGAYLGNTVLYATMQDPTIMQDMKLRDDIDPALKDLLTRADSSFQELYHSDTKLALKMVASDEKVETILVQDLATGTVIDTNISAHANFKFLGRDIVYFVPSTSAAARPDELVQPYIYDIETNLTEQMPALAAGESFTKMLDQYANPIADLKITNGKVEAHIYSSKDPARFDTARTSLRTASYMSGR